MTRSMAEESTKAAILSVEEQKQLVDDAIERLDRLAESEVEMARLFISRGKNDIARRRLQEVIKLYSKSDAAKEAKKLLKSV